MALESLLKIFFVIPFGFLFIFIVVGIIANVFIGMKDKADGKTEHVLDGVKSAVNTLRKDLGV